MTSTSSPCSSLGSCCSRPSSSSGRAPGSASARLPVDGPPSGDQHQLAAGAEHVGRHGRLDAGVLEHGVGVEDRQEPADDQVVDPAVVLVHLVDRMALGAGRDDRVVVGDLEVVDDPLQRQLLEAEHVLGAGRVLGLGADEPRDRLDLGDHVAGQVARVRARVRQRLVLLVEPLGRGERPSRGEAEAGVGVALQRGEVVEQLRALLALGLLELRDLAGLAVAVADDGLRLGGGLDPRVRAGVVAALVAARAVLGGVELGVDDPVGLGLEVADLLLAPGEDRQRRRLHAAERDRAVERGAQADRRRPGRVHADDPVGLRARSRRGLERGQLGPGAQPPERLLDRLGRHRVQPQPLDRLLRRGLLVQVGEDQLALASGVARVDDRLDLGAAEQPLDDVHLLLRALVADDQAELLRHDRQIGHPPLLEAVVVLIGVGELHEVADGPRDRVVGSFQVALVLGERGREARARGRARRSRQRVAVTIAASPAMAL